MKKETRVKDLPKVLQTTIHKNEEHNFTYEYSEVYNGLAQKYLDQIDWQSVTDAERLAYCEVRYPKGTKVKSCVGTIGEVGDKIVRYDNGAGGIKAENAYTKSYFLILYSGVNGKFAEIIEDEVKEPIFKVGDRPKWTPELIKQLPHGSKIKCAFNDEVATWSGQELYHEEFDYLKFYIDQPKTLEPVWFYDEGRYAKIISLPETQSIKEKLKGTCVLNESVEMGAEIVKLYTEAGIENSRDHTGEILNSYYGYSLLVDAICCVGQLNDHVNKVLTLDQLRSIVRGEKQTESQSKSGHDIDFRDDANRYMMCNKFKEYHEKMSKELREVKSESVEFKEGEYNCIGFNEIFKVIHAEGSEVWIRSKSGKTNTIVTVDSLRKIDPDKEYSDLAEELMKDINFMLYPMVVKDTKRALIEAMKRVKK